VTQVTRKKPWLQVWLVLFLTGAAISNARQISLTAAPLSWRHQVLASDTPAKPAETLYLQLSSVGIDPGQTFHIRGASIDRSALHLTFEDGEISFTSRVNGQITGAFFAGDGEVLLTPPNRAERESMTLFTGMAILEERFSTAFLRFNDQTFAELQPYLRPSDDAKEFRARWNDAAHHLAEFDALRLFDTFSRSLPPASGSTQLPEIQPVNSSADRMLHARLQGENLGTFDVNFDSTAFEQIWAGQARMVNGVTYYNLWTSFGLGNPSSATQQDPADEVRISRYKIQAHVKPPTTLQAEAWLTVNVRRGGPRTIFFELSRFLQVKQVDLDGRPVEFIDNPAVDGTQLARRGNDQVAVVFPEPLRPGQTLQLHFVYGGDVLSEAGGGLLYVGARGIWYPNLGMRMSDFDLEFRYPQDWTLVATGKQVAPEPAGDLAQTSDMPVPGEQVSRWVTERPSTLAGFNLGKYHRVTAHAGNITIATYAARGVEKTFPRGSESVVTIPDPLAPRLSPGSLLRESDAPSPVRNAQAVTDQAARALEFFSKQFGPCPYSVLNLTQMPGPISQGWPGLVFLSSYSFLTPGEESALHLDATQKILNRLVLPHEIAHQWWGDLVGWRSYRDQWIVEALANYSALMMLQQENPLDFRKAMDQYRADLLEKNKQGEFLRDAGPVALGLRLNSSHFPNGYEAISYGRGTWLLHMLRYMLLDAEASEARSGHKEPEREEPFVRALRNLRERYAGKEITTRELIGVFEENLPRPLWYEGRKSLDWFVQGWVEGIAIPHFSLHNVKLSPKSGGIAASGTILQKDAPEDLVTAVPVYATGGAKPVLLGTVFADGPETSFHLTAPSGTKKVMLDVNQTLLTNPK
jgi:hypothetical protein